MLFFKRVLLLAATTSAVAVLPRTAQDVISALGKADTDLINCCSLAKSWNGSTSSISPIVNCISQIDSDLKEATKKVNSQYNAADSNSIIDYLKNHFYPDLQCWAVALEARKQDVDKTGLTPTVRSRCQILRSDAATLINALLSWTDHSARSAAKNIGGKILATIDDLIKTYGG